MNGRIERDFCSDIHLVEIRQIQREQRKPLINWYAVIGIVMMITSATLVIWCFANVLDTL